MLIARISEAAQCGIDLIQLREKDLPGRALESLTQAAVQAVRDHSQSTRLLINSRTDVAIACAAGGVHLTSTDISPLEVRRIWQSALASRQTLISVSCHSEADIIRAQAEAADLAVFAPVFEKKDAPSIEPVGLHRLHRVCSHEIPVLALGGVNLENAADCMKAGAAGIAGIRLFQQGNLRETVQKLRALGAAYVRSSST